MATTHPNSNQASGTLGGIVGSQLTIYYASHICDHYATCINTYPERQYQCKICGKKWK